MSEHELTDTQRAYVLWFVTPNRGTKKAYAEEHAIPLPTLYGWERQAWWRPAIEAEMLRLNLSPDRLQAVIDAMWTAASNGDVQAAKVYLAYIERLNPTKPVEQHDHVEELSDEELEKYLLA